ncbi:MAG TPA: O-antigen ligase family protein [Candidatus Acidoferrum sp.]|nr:O-antigen ligase family protein [Candidatus Acidoferrum sp.]
MIASRSLAGRWGPAVASTNASRVPWLVLGPVAAAVMMLPALKPSGPGNSSPVDALIGLSLAVTLLWVGYAGQTLRLPYGIAVALIMIGGSIASLAGPLPATGLLAVVQDLVVLLWCAVIVNVARSADAFRWLLRAWAWGSFGWALVLIFAVATNNLALAGESDRTGVRASLTFGDPNYAANYFFVALMIVMATQTPRRKVVRMIAYACLLTALALTGSNGGILACAIGLTVVAIAFVARRWGPIPLVAVASTAAVLGIIGFTAFQALPIEEWAANSGQPLLRDSIGRSSQSAQERAWLIQETFVLFQEGVPWGLGPGSTKPLLQSQLAPYAYQTHDDYIESIVERGLIGAFGLLVLIGSLGVRAWAVATKPLAPEFAALFPRIAPLIGALLGLAVSASYYQILHFRHVWAFFAVIAALYVWGRRSPEPALVST